MARHGLKARNTSPSSTLAVSSAITSPITSAVSWLLKFSLQSDKISLLDLRTLCDWDIRNRILSIPGIASVVCMGPGPKQYQVLLSSPKLLQYNITVKEVVEALKETNRNVPGGLTWFGGRNLSSRESEELPLSKI